MHLAIRLNLYRAATVSVPVDLMQAADDLGYHSVRTAEAYGADALSSMADTFEASVLAVAERVVGVPSDLAQINKRSVHRAFDDWGARAGTELQALAAHTAIATADRTARADEGHLGHLAGTSRSRWQYLS